MPVWHKKTLEARKSGKLVVLGVIQEQHADRCRLFAQWQGIDWPILHDPINQVGPRAVPIFVAIDEAGTVVDAKLSVSNLKSFLRRPKPEGRLATGVAVDEAAPTTGTGPAVTAPGSSWLALGDKALLGKESGNAEAAIGFYQRLLDSNSKSAAAWFRLGVAHRTRYDSSQAQDQDFGLAAEAWDRALSIDPNHYVYRRRIQQYGPRLDKPYPFYDWIEQARSEILARGDIPVQLVAEPVGAEIAKPIKQIRERQTGEDEPDPNGRITRDGGQFVSSSIVVVPGKIEPGQAVRVHLTLRPKRDTVWNNETEPIRVWLHIPNGWKTEKSMLEFAQSSQAESRVPRSIDFELRSGPKSKQGTIKGYALYSICEKNGGTCLYRRLDFQIPIEFKSE